MKRGRQKHSEPCGTCENSISASSCHLSLHPAWACSISILPVGSSSPTASSRWERDPDKVSNQTAAAPPPPLPPPPLGVPGSRWQWRLRPPQVTGRKEGGLLLRSPPLQARRGQAARSSSVPWRQQPRPRGAGSRASAAPGLPVTDPGAALTRLGLTWRLRPASRACCNSPS